MFLLRRAKMIRTRVFPTGHVRLFYRRALLPLAFDSTVSSSKRRKEHSETRVFDPLTDPNDNRTIRDTESKKGRTISRGGRRIENGSTARGREYRRGQFDDPSGDLRARHPFILSQKEVAILTPTTITGQLLSANLFIATRESIGDSPTRDDNVSRSNCFLQGSIYDFA